MQTKPTPPSKKITSKLLVLLLALVCFSSLFLFINLFRIKSNTQSNPVNQKGTTPTTNEETVNVLGRNTYKPTIYIQGTKNGYSAGGVIAIASTDEPAIQIGSYDVAGDAEISIYEANEDAVLDYLLHDKENKQVTKNFDKTKFRYITKVTQPINTKQGSAKVTLPLAETGIWYLELKLGSAQESAYVVRSNNGLLLKEGDNQFIFWGQSFKTGKSIQNGTLKIYSLLNEKKVLSENSFNSEGITKAALSVDADLAIAHIGNDVVIIPINLYYLNNFSYRPFQIKSQQVKYFVFTDRPLYKPGDTIFFKTVLRDDDDARYTIPSGLANVKIYKDWDEKNIVFEKNYPVTSDGTVYGEYKLAEESATGNYNLKVTLPDANKDQYSWENVSSFQVEYFRKPEYSIDISVPKTEIISGDVFSFKISGNYFSGQALSNQKVKYTINTADFYEYDYLSDRPYSLSDEYRYGYWYGKKVSQGDTILNASGEAEVTVDTKHNRGKAQVFSLEAELDDGSGNPSFARKNILVFAGEFGIFKKAGSPYSSKVGVPLSLPIILAPYRAVNMGNIPLTVKISRDEWVAYQDPNQKYPSYRKESETLPTQTIATDSQGNAVVTLTPAKTGSYVFTIESKDTKNNVISKSFYIWIGKDNYPYYSGDQGNELTIKGDKEKYSPKETASFTISSDIGDRDVFLSFDRGRVNRYQIVHLKGKTATVDVPLVETDMPNIYAEISSFSNMSLDSSTLNVLVSPEKKRIVVNITPDQKTYGPSDTVALNIQTNDTAGNPVSADLAVWAVDKALFELVDQKPEKIFDTFWNQRSNDTQETHSLQGIVVSGAERGGCFAEGTQILLPDGKTQSIESIKVGDTILTRKEEDPKQISSKVVGVHKSTVSGYLIVNGQLKVTTNHILRLNNVWQEAGNIQVGDLLTGSNGESVLVTSLEWIRGNFNVYNLEIEKYHTYFAQNLWVHNQKGDGGRSVFKDTAYWNPSLHTDSSGRGKISFKLPDNLTTWVVAALGSSVDTKVGQVTNDIVVTKSIIVRPILPNIMREKDKIVLSALVQNFTENKQAFDVDLTFDAGKVEQATHSAISIASKETKQLNWTVLVGDASSAYPEIEKDKAKVTISARSKENDKNTDTITQEIPVRAFGFTEKRAETGDGPKEFSISLAKDSLNEKSSISLSLAPTIAGTLPDSVKYLIGYPYGCVEQTTSRFVPAVVAKANPKLFASALEGKDIDDIVQKGVERLALLQHNDGGWSWWSSGNSDPIVTSYVFEYLMMAKNTGIKFNDDGIIIKAQKFLENDTYYDPKANTSVKYGKEELIAKTHALSMTDSPKGKIKLNDFANVSPDFVSLAVITNAKNGDKNPQTNGLSTLLSISKNQGDDIFWEAGSKEKFGSVNSSTAIAIRAILDGGGQRETAVKAMRFLTRNRRYDYWSNTYATVQVIRAINDFSNTGEELSPNYTYSVLLDGKEVGSGLVNNQNQVININIKGTDIKQGGSSLTITKNGEGQIYSTLIIKEYHTDRNAQANSHGLDIIRTYVSNRGEEYSLAVGDEVTVRITLSGLNAEENYGVIEDQLPSGLVPINTSFKNEQFGQDASRYYNSYNVSDTEITENGAILSLYRIPSTTQSYTYKARVISEGEFIVPPAFASLMYAPEIYGHSTSQTIKTTNASQIIAQKAIKKTIQQGIQSPTPNIGILFIGLIIFVIIVILIIKLKKHQIPPPPTP